LKGNPRMDSTFNSEHVLKIKDIWLGSKKFIFASVSFASKTDSEPCFYSLAIINQENQSH